MPIYMDRHELDEPVTQKELAMAHYQDLLIQDQFDAKSMTYWQSEDGKTAFCLIDAPNPEALKKMHAASHGLIPHKIIEVDPEEVLSILGRITDPTGVKDLDKYEENVDEYAADHGSPFRVIMFTDLKDSTLMQTELGEEKALEMLRTHNELIRTAIKPHNGQEVKHTGDGLMISYLNVSDALAGGASIQAAFDEHNQNNPDDAMYVRIGFSAGDTIYQSTLLAVPESSLISGVGESENAYTPAAVRLIDVPGTTIEQVAGSGVSDLGQVRVALVEATREAFEAGEESVDVEMTLRLPYGDDGGQIVNKTWTLSRDELERLHALRWVSPLGAIAFAPEEFLLKGSSPIDSLDKGLSETRRVMLSTYTTFVRLFQGTVKVQHLKGPVGIAHLGTMMAEKGWVWLLFLAAIVSVNLAVINFMPLPIVDGGQFLFLIFEGLRGKPVPVGIQNAFALAGIVLIGAVFIIVTFNDIVGLFGGS